jgi:hypothetical protein
VANAFWGQLQRLENLSHGLKADLESDRLALMKAYSAARSDPNKSRGSTHQQILNPQIHNNSVLRLRYRDLTAKFNAAVSAASAALKKIGITPSTLSGLGQLGPIPVVPIIAVTALGAAFLIYESVRTATDAQRKATAGLLKILSDPTASDEQKKEAAAALRKTATTPTSDIFGFGNLVPVLGIIAAIIIVPQVLKALPRRAT